MTERDRSRTPLFQALLDYYTVEMDDGWGLDAGDGGTGLQDARSGVLAKLDLRLVSRRTPAAG